MYDITLHRLRIFKCIVETGGIRSAAVILGISQPSVSAHVRSLEAVIGQPLLDRRPGKSGSLTDAGRILYDFFAHDVIVGADSVAGLLRDLTVGRRGSVSFAATRTLGASVLGPILTEHYRSSPGVLVSAHTGTLVDVTEMVLTGAVPLVSSAAHSPNGGVERAPSPQSRCRGRTRRNSPRSDR